ncbi:TPA: DUF262 domain-containing protein, partial [Haemophilus influenzae]
MSYQGISIRKVLDKINANTNGWYLPEVQRQYVLGNRNNSEEYVCLLLDSLLKGYPIGGIVIWDNEEKIPFRPFLTDYAPNQFNKLVEKGRWGESKSLVYDGQQRLQTLYSVLKYTFNNRVLHYDLRSNEKNLGADETGFLFLDKNEESPLYYIKMTELCSKKGKESERIELEYKLAPLFENKDSELIIKTNLAKLWETFVKDNSNLIAYFSVKADSPQVVNEIFRRLNIGGVSLTLSELVLSKIKSKYYDFEERLWELSEKIKEKSDGIEFYPESRLLQLIYLLVKETIRVDDRYFKDSDIDLFYNELKSIEYSVLDFFSYLREK